MTLAEELEAALPPGGRLTFAELELSRSDDGAFHARHRDDAGAAPGELEPADSPAELRELARFTESGEFRPLKTAPTLKRGWRCRAEGAAVFLDQLDALYPGLFATWVAYRDGQLHPVPLRETLNRQTGMYRFAGNITDAMANRIMRDLCAAGCLRKIAWPIDDQAPLGTVMSPPGAIPAICTEACTLAVSEARRLAKEAYDARNAPGPCA